MYDTAHFIRIFPYRLVATIEFDRCQYIISVKQTQ